MGACWCKEKREQVESYFPGQQLTSTAAASPPYHVRITATGHVENAEKGCPEPETVDELVLQTLGCIGTIVDNEQEPPPSMLRLHLIADNEDGWIQVVKSMVHVIPMYNPLGPSVITLLLDDCPLPSRESVQRVIKMFHLSRERAINSRNAASRERNLCVVLGCMAEKLAGPSSQDILNEDTLDYLLTNLNPESDPHVILFSLIALEKFAQTSVNKVTIIKRLELERPCPITRLEEWRHEEHDVKRQVGFCAQWALDNLFVHNDRTFTYMAIDMGNINAMLNTSDVSEYLKISADGLEARCDAYSFESVRCTAQADSGVWYYEVKIITPGVMQIGWATKESNFLNHEGYGIGDDKYSLAYDGCRRLVWYNAKSDKQALPRWRPGDILGCLLDLDAQQIVFAVNGTSLAPSNHVFSMAKSGFFPAASFMSFQQCRFNFGSEPFVYPPEGITFNAFNTHGTLGADEKRVLPRHVFLAMLREQCDRDEDSCTLCYDRRASVQLIPCKHAGICETCASQLNECPMCRGDIWKVDVLEIPA